MKQQQRRLLGALVAGTALIGVAQEASAHATSIGFENAGPGAVTVWLGTYQHGGHHLEGSMRLEGVLGTVFGPVVNPFTMLTGTGVGFKPGGLVDGVTNFYISGPVGGNGPLVNDESAFLAQCPACGPTNHWQGVTFAGLSPGDYKFTYVPIANPTAEWTPWNDNLNGTFNLSGTIINPTPEPAPLALAALGLAALALGRRKLKA